MRPSPTVPGRGWIAAATALRRLGELSPDGVIRLQDGSQLRGWLPLELTAAALQAGRAVGYLALLRAIVTGLEPERLHRPVLRSVIAPELSASRFGEILDAAERRERACHGRSARRAGSLGAVPAL